MYERLAPVYLMVGQLRPPPQPPHTSGQLLSHPSFRKLNFFYHMILELIIFIGYSYTLFAWTYDQFATVGTMENAGLDTFSPVNSHKPIICMYMTNGTSKMFHSACDHYKVFRHSKRKLVLCSKQIMRLVETDHVICFSQSHGYYTLLLLCFLRSASFHLLCRNTLYIMCTIERYWCSYKT